MFMVLLTAGCFSPAPPTDSPEPAADAVEWPQLDDLACEAPVADGMSANLRLLARAPLDEAGAAVHRELDHDPIRPLVVAARYVEGSFDIIDVSDPRAPVVLATWTPPVEGYALDVKFTADGQSVLVATPTTIHLVDVREPTAPRHMTSYELEEPTAHMLSIFGVGGREYVTASKGEGGDLSIFEIRGDPANRTLDPTARPVLTPVSFLPKRGEESRTHDAWFEVDPETRAPTLWIANVWFGVAALDVSDPASPRLIATIPHEDPYFGYTHTVRVAHVDGKRLVVAGTEYGVGALKVWDASSLADPKLVATWSLDGAPPHNIQVVGNRAYVTYFEHGFYILDLTDAVGGNLPVLAHMPATGEWTGTRLPGNLLNPYFGPVDAIVKDGLIYVGEETAGLSVLAYGCLTPGDNTATSRG